MFSFIISQLFDLTTSLFPLKLWWWFCEFQCFSFFFHRIDFFFFVTEFTRAFNQFSLLPVALAVLLDRILPAFLRRLGARRRPKQSSESADAPVSSNIFKDNEIKEEKGGAGPWRRPDDDRFDLGRSVNGPVGPKMMSEPLFFVFFAFSTSPMPWSRWRPAASGAGKDADSDVSWGPLTGFHCVLLGF